MLFERRAFDRVYGDDEDLELGGLDKRLQRVGLTASQGCRSSALCRREVLVGALKEGPRSTAVQRRYSYRRASGRGLEQRESCLFVSVSSPGRSSYVAAKRLV